MLNLEKLRDLGVANDVIEALPPFSLLDSTENYEEWRYQFAIFADLPAFVVIGKSDVNWLLLDKVTGAILVAADDDGQFASYTNASLSHFIQCVEIYKTEGINLPTDIYDTLSEGERAARIKTALLAIDESILSDEESLWAIIIEEMENGIL